MSTKFIDKSKQPPLDLILDELIRDKNQLLSKSLDAHSLGNGQFHILNEVNWKEGISQEEIARIRKIDKSAVARSVKRLIENGYINKERDQQDGRAFRLYPTDKGRQMMPQIKRIVQELDQTLSQGSTPEEIELFKKICRRMNQNIENAAAPQCG
ncbi:MarR family winged helix-turn-helix transcriptional regulator [Coraliomargarita sp. SDUM461003]|uniref:MarR family winged helix-turn-helix transcriptional regulator n=1 Tax=Thalassobacterium maritimum TaxID=3041265 RepID=A0ABU1AZ72_9BACT|nr:MarR family winged helix-turn-helix transcriptional regulator [Coraliomargarita sp. SDUM461003]MDQ8209453.1 MarR family winged helix-turn-helix transcriptional regulator [Coraliomargarita sp. SDUM461003]